MKPSGLSSTTDPHEAATPAPLQAATRRCAQRCRAWTPSGSCGGLDHTCHVDVVLETQDNHQAIFESLNAKFEPLSLLDKVRNFALMGLDDDEMTRVWDGPWRVIEDRYGSSGEEDRGRKEAAFGLFARDLLVLAGARERRQNEDPYARIRRWAKRWETGHGDGHARFVSYLAEQAKFHAAFTLGVAVPGRSRRTAGEVLATERYARTCRAPAAQRAG